jgi:very-short-patch-repair endonuclease
LAALFLIFIALMKVLGIELDGALHFDKDNIEYDKIRTEIINKYNIKIIRFENYLIMEDIEKVLEEIKSHFKN